MVNIDKPILASATLRVIKEKIKKKIIYSKINKYLKLKKLLI